MTDPSYTRFSNLIKIVFLIATGVLGLVQYNFSQLASLSFSTILAIIAIGLMVTAIIDKSHKEIYSKLSSLHDTLRSNFEYHGIIDSVKNKFTANEMQELWPILILKVKKEFIALNYLSKESWECGGGDSLVKLLGIRMEIERINARRLFVIKNIEEYEEWQSTFSLHKRYKIYSKYILQSDYNEAIRKFSKANKEFKFVKGFNVLDPDTVGIVVDWVYENRATNGAILKKGSEISKEYTQLFDTLWCSAKELN